MNDTIRHRLRLGKISLLSRLEIDLKSNKCDLVGDIAYYFSKKISISCFKNILYIFQLYDTIFLRNYILIFSIIIIIILKDLFS